MFRNLSFLLKKDMKKQKLTTCNMMFLILEPSFKNLHLILFLIGYEEGVNVAEEYDKRSLYHMLLSVFIICIQWQNLKLDV